MQQETKEISKEKVDIILSEFKFMDKITVVQYDIYETDGMLMKESEYYIAVKKSNGSLQIIPKKSITHIGKVCN